MMKREPKRSASWTRGGSSTQQSGSGTPGGAARWCRRHMAMAGAARAIVSLAARDRRALLILFLQATHLARELLAYSVTYGVRSGGSEPSAMPAWPWTSVTSWRQRWQRCWLRTAVRSLGGGARLSLKPAVCCHAAAGK